MALTQITNREPTPIKRAPCTVCVALAELDDQSSAALRALLADPAWRYTELAEALAADEDTPLTFQPETLSRHARGRCAAREKLR